MRANTAKARLRQGKPIVGPILPFASEAMIELCALAGFHFVFIDCEHGPMSVETVERLVRACEVAGIPSLARVPDQNPQTILRFLDTGLQGVLVPHIDTAEQAAAAVGAAKYAPEGHRGLAGVRAGGYGIDLPLAEYVRRANEEVMVWVLLESRAAVENVAAIATVPGIDVLQIGPTDLAMSMLGMPDSRHPEVEQALDRILAAGRAAGKAVGRGAVSGPAHMRRELERGFSVITFGLRDLVVEPGRRLMAELDLSGET